MKKSLGLLSLFALLCAVLSLASVPAMAQSGGGGGGGGTGGGGGGGGSARHGGNYNLIFDYAPAINGVTPVCVGSYGLTTYITTLSLNLRISSCDLPNGTPLTVTVYARDYYNGTPWVPKVAGTMTVNSHAAALAVSSLWTTPAGGLPVITSVVITAPDGSVVVSGHP